MLKHQLKIVFSLLFLLTINLSFAAGTENNPKKPQEQDQQAIQRDQEGTLEGQQLEKGEESYQEESEEPEQEIKTDSVEDDSVSKYNFIFYFLYKFKYEAEA